MYCVSQVLFFWAPDHDFGEGAITETSWLAKEFIKSPKLPIKFYMDAGLFEVDTTGSGGGILEPSRQMRDVLLARGYEVHYRQFASGHDYLITNMVRRLDDANWYG